MKNFILLFHGREGSSAIITHLGSHPQITVPLFEDFDYKNFKTAFPDVSFPGMLEAIFATGQLKSAYELVKEGGCPLPARGQQSIGFKWRPWGRVEQIAGILATSNVAVFPLYRRDIVEMVASLYFTWEVVPNLPGLEELGITGGQMQFRFSALREQEKAQVRSIIDQERFRLPVEYARQRILTALKQKQRTAEEFILPLIDQGLDVVNLYYEDYVSDASGFVGNVFEILGCSAPSVEASGPTFEKARRGDIRQQIENLDEINSDPVVREAVAAFEALIESQRMRTSE